MNDKCNECNYRKWMNKFGEDINDKNCPIKEGCNEYQKEKISEEM